MKALQDKTIFHTQVHFMRALQRVADKVCSNRQERSIYIKLGSLTMDQHEEDKVIQLFKALSGETSLQLLPEEVLAALPQATSSLDTALWKSATSWVQWWTKPTHLSMYTVYVVNPNVNLCLNSSHFAREGTYTPPRPTPLGRYSC